MARDETIKLSLIDGVSKNLTQIQQGVTGVGASLAKLNQSAELAAKGFGLIAGAVDGLTGLVKAAGGVELAMARVSDITQATTEEQVALQKAVESAAVTVGVSADQAAGALLLMAEDGFSASEAVGSLNTVLQFAKANAQDAATATQALGGVLDTFGEKPQIIAELADQLTAAARAAGVGTTTLQQGLAAIGVQAEQAGLGVSESVAALAALASRGIEGTQAAKQLGIVLTQLNDPASKAGKALNEAGLSGKSFSEIVAVLSKDSAKAAPILEALGARPRAALKVLLAEGGGALLEFTDIVKNAGGASADAAAVVDKTFIGALDRFQASIGNLRNQFLIPILKPLADEFTALSLKLNQFAGSPEFDRIRTQFQAFSTAAIQAIGDLAQNIDLEAIAEDISYFGTKAKSAFESLVVVVEATAGAIRGIGAAVEYVAQKADEFDAAMGFAEGGATRLNVAARETGKGLESLGVGLDKNKKSTREFSTAADAAGKSSARLAVAVADTGAAAVAAADDLGEMPKAAKLVEISNEKLAGSAAQVAIGLERLRLSTLVAAQATLANANLSNTDTFRALTIEIGKTEASITAMQAAIDKAAKSQDDLSNKTDKAADSLRGQASASREAAGAADRASDSTQQAAAATENYGKSAAAAKVSLGNYSQELIALGQQMQKQAFSARAIIDVWRQIREVYDQSNRSVERAIDVLQKQNTALSEEERIRQLALKQFGPYTTRIEELIRLRIEQARANREANDEAEREIQIVERRQQQIAGGIGITRPAQTADQPAPAVAGRGAAAGGDSGRSAGSQTVNVTINGLPADRDGWRAAVAEFIVPEINRLQRLAR